MTILNVCVGEKKIFLKNKTQPSQSDKNSLLCSPLKKESVDSYHYFTPTECVSAGQTSATLPVVIPLTKSS